jgi:hypothetical protein
VGLSILGPNMGPKNRAFQYGAFLTPLDITTDVVFLFIFCKIAKFGGYILCGEEYNSLFSHYS